MEGPQFSHCKREGENPWPNVQEKWEEAWAGGQLHPSGAQSSASLTAVEWTQPSVRTPVSPEEMEVLSELCDSSFLPLDPQGRQESWGQEVSS